MKNKYYPLKLIALAGCLLTSEVQAFHFDESNHAIKFGATVNTGNSETVNISGAITNELDYKQWRYNSSLDGQLATSGGEESARNLNGNVELDRDFNASTFSFIKGSVLYNKYATYDLIIRESIGIGRVLFQNKAHRLSLQSGPGYIHRRIAGIENFQNKSFFSVNSKYRWKMSDNAEFKQSLSSDIDSITTHLEAVSSINTKIIKNLALELSFTVSHDTKIPALSKNQKKTDTASKVTLVYGF
tara:strand:+ start:53 stop:784 length:732 start_codon:yes stop_codon:yes gene_type:complete